MCRSLIAVAISLLGILCTLCAAAEVKPVEHLARDAAYTGPQNFSGAEGRPPVLTDGRLATGYGWAYIKTPLVLTFPEPVEMNKVEAGFFPGSGAWYQFVVEGSPDGEQWEILGARQEGEPRGLQTVVFPCKAYIKLRLRVTKTDYQAGSYHIEEFAVFNQEDPAADSPLKQAYESLRAEPEPEKPVTKAAMNKELIAGILGPESVVPEDLYTKLLASPPGQRFYEDVDGDGDPDVVTFVDTAERHTVQPIIVRVIDDDDDLEEGGLPDKDSDCYCADWRANGVIDRAVDFWDEDGDGDPDRQDIYYRVGLWHPDSLCVIVIRDIGDDDRMWWTRNYEYDQPGCQWRSDFNGDEIFTMYYYDEEQEKFIPLFEDPFAHYDTDDDGLAEVTVRVNGGKGPEIRTLRYSFDVDNDTNWLNRRDYDFSFNCKGPVSVAGDVDQKEVLRDGSVCDPYLAWDRVREVVEAAPWKENRLCWDECDNNVNVLHEYQRWHERWEGVGGYRMREGNKRWETDSDYSGRMALYYSPVDRRIHLYGAEEGFVRVDYDFDNETDMNLGYKDGDGDGYFDTWSFDGDGDGTPERTYQADPRPVAVKARYPDLTGCYAPALAEALELNQRLIDTMKTVLEGQAASQAEDWFLNKRPESFYNPGKLAESREAIRYFQDLVREELYTQVLAAARDKDWDLDAVREAYARGAYGETAGLLAKAAGVEVPDAEPWFSRDGMTFTRRIRVVLNEPAGMDRPSVPVVIPLEELQRAAADFNPACFAVTGVNRRLFIAEYPSQADDLDQDGVADEVVFTVDLSANEETACFIYYNPRGEWDPGYAPRTNARDGINVVGVGWESELIGYRSYYGKFDFFGKRLDGLHLDDLGAYHQRAEWGMDVLHVGPSPGIGGFSFWYDTGTRAGYPVWKSGCPFRAYNEEDEQRVELTQAVVAGGPVRAAIRLDLANAVPDTGHGLSVLASVYAGQIYSENRLRVTGMKPGTDPPILSTGIVAIDGADVAFDKDTAAVTSWGDQKDPAIGVIGQAVIAPPGHIHSHVTTENSEELLFLPRPGGTMTVYAAGEWGASRSDQRRLVAYSAAEWRRHVARLAKRVLAPVEWTLGGAEQRD